MEAPRYSVPRSSTSSACEFLQEGGFSAKAVRICKIDVVRCLLGRGPDPKIRDVGGQMDVQMKT